MKVLVTGGAGFIGSWIVDKLIEKSNQVVVVDNLSTGNRKNVNKMANFYELDITDNNKLNDIFEIEKPGVVFHAAANAMLRKSLEDPIFDANVNINGTISVLECCRKNKVKKIIYTSTGGARVGEPEYLPVDEKHPINPSSPYGISKHTAEHYIWTYNKLYGIDYLIFCFGNVYGPRDDIKAGRLIAVFINKILNGETPKIFGDGEQTRDFIYVKDLAEFLVNNIDKNPESKIFNLANGKKISVNEIVSLLKKVAGIEFSVEHIDPVKGEVRNIELNVNLARKELSWNPRTDIETGLKETLDWFSNDY